MALLRAHPAPVTDQRSEQLRYGSTPFAGAPKPLCASIKERIGVERLALKVALQRTEQRAPFCTASAMADLKSVG